MKELLNFFVICIVAVIIAALIWCFIIGLAVSLDDYNRVHKTNYNPPYERMETEEAISKFFVPGKRKND